MPSFSIHANLVSQMFCIQSIRITRMHSYSKVHVVNISKRSIPIQFKVVDLNLIQVVDLNLMQVVMSNLFQNFVH